MTHLKVEHAVRVGTVRVSMLGAAVALDCTAVWLVAAADVDGVAIAVLVLGRGAAVDVD